MTPSGTWYRTAREGCSSSARPRPASSRRRTPPASPPRMSPAARTHTSARSTRRRARSYRGPIRRRGQLGQLRSRRKPRRLLTYRLDGVPHHPGVVPAILRRRAVRCLCPPPRSSAHPGRRLPGHPLLHLRGGERSRHPPGSGHGRELVARPPRRGGSRARSGGRRDRVSDRRERVGRLPDHPGLLSAAQGVQLRRVPHRAEDGGRGGPRSRARLLDVRRRRVLRLWERRRHVAGGARLRRRHRLIGGLLRSLVDTR